VQSLKSEQGQTLVEFALILPILLVLVIGIFDFGSAFNHKNDLNFLANTAARYAEVNQCLDCTGSETINTHVANQADFTPVPTITMCYPSGTHGVGDPLRVSASAPFNWLGANLPGLPTGSTTLTSTVTVRILQDPGATPLYTGVGGAPPTGC
jgi:Flp pilus assembly protein TadG